MTAILIKFQWNYIRNNYQSFIFLLTFIGVNVILFFSRFFEYYHNHHELGWFVWLARANGQCLNFTCAFIIVLVFRRSITKLRSMGFSEYLPLDHHVYFHKLTGWAIVFYSVFHTAMHALNFNVLSKKTSVSLFDYLFSPFLGIGWIGGVACLTGWVMLLILVVMMITAQPFMRRSGKFEVFYYSHLLYIPFYICLFLHAPRFWIWFSIPFFIFCIEWALRIMKSYSGDRGLTYIEQGVILPSRVIQLIIKRPANFNFHPGDYLYIQIPMITKYEWHPMTVSSAPEQQDIIWLHIRAVGQWTNRVYNYFNNEANIKTGFELDCRVHKLIRTHSNQACTQDGEDKREDAQDLVQSPSIKRQRSSTFSAKSHQEAKNQMLKDTKVMILPVPNDCDEYGCGRQSAMYKKRNDDIETAPSIKPAFSFSSLRFPMSEREVLKNAIILDRPLKVRLDGPYGSPSSHIFHTQHAVLIATGIGVTPFASILQSIMLRYIEAKRSCPSCAHSWSDPIPPNVMKLRKVDFMWINRDQTSFEWFVSLLSELQVQQERLHEKDRFLDIHMHITGKGNVKERRSSFNLDDTVRSESNDGLIWHRGRPDWNKFFKQMSEKRKGRITVFFCGRNDLARTLRSICSRFGFQFRKEVF